MTSKFWLNFSFGYISVLVTFQFWWNFSFGDISFLVTFQVSWHFSLWHFNFGDLSILKGQGNITVSPALQPNKPQTNYADIVPIQIFFWTCWKWEIWRSAIINILPSPYSNIFEESLVGRLKIFLSFWVQRNHNYFFDKSAWKLSNFHKDNLQSRNIFDRPCVCILGLSFRVSF